MGPFFWRLRRDLEAVGATVYKINFCPGDRLYYPLNAIDYRGTPNDWPTYLSRLLVQLGIDVVFLFGDCRRYHRMVPDVIRWQKAEMYVFEEGYLRPDYITLEKGGANNFSSLPRDPDVYRTYVSEQPAEQVPRKVTNSFSRAAAHSILYALANAILGWRYPHYQHHRSLSPLPQAFYWLRAGWRKYYFGWREKALAQRLVGPLAHRYFIVPLQTHNDAQISVHSDFSSVEDFIERVLISFAQQARPDHVLVFKHHPLDRGYREYGRFIQRLAQRHGLNERVFYVHDVHLPTLLDHALGCVVINSTVGLSSILHRTPVCVLGDPIYHMPGLTFQGTLEAFWRAPGQVDSRLFEQFRAWLRAHNQANGNFYRPLPKVGNRTGVLWPPAFERDWAQISPSSRFFAPSSPQALCTNPVVLGQLAAMKVQPEL
jgi:capsule polysaccharide modification protein KpsS